MKTPYETMFLIPPASTEEQTNQIIERVQEAITRKSGEVTTVRRMGVRKTAYAVNKMNSACYVLVQYRGSGDTIDEVERILKNSDEVLKYLSTKITTKPVAPKPVTPPAVETPATEPAVDNPAAPEPAGEPVRE